MAASITQDPASEALLVAARSHSTGEERKCHALLSLLEACSSLSRNLRRCLAENDLTENGFRILAIVVRKDPFPTDPNRIAELLKLQPQAVSMLLGRLEVSGLIRREKPQRRSHRWPVRATEDGRRVFKSALCHCDRQIRELMSALDADAVRVLEESCCRLHDLCSQEAEKTS